MTKATGAMAMSDVVTWQDDPGVAGQRIGRVGNFNMFVVCREGPGRFILGSADPFGTDRGMIAFASNRFASAQEAQQTAEERIAQTLRALDLVPRRTS